MVPITCVYVTCTFNYLDCTKVRTSGGMSVIYFRFWHISYHMPHEITIGWHQLLSVSVFWLLRTLTELWYSMSVLNNQKMITESNWCKMTTILHHIWWFMCKILDYKIEMTLFSEIYYSSNRHTYVWHTQMIGTTDFVSWPWKGNTLKAVSQTTLEQSWKQKKLNWLLVINAKLYESLSCC